MSDIREVSICGLIIFVRVNSICEKCNQEKENILYYGEVCVNCDSPEPFSYERETKS